METRFRANKKFYNHDKEPDRFLGIRNILNIIFMLGAQSQFLQRWFLKLLNVYYALSVNE